MSMIYVLKNTKIIMEEILKDPRKLQDTSCSHIGRLKVAKMPILKMIYQINVNSI